MSESPVVSIPVAGGGHAVVDAADAPITSASVKKNFLYPGMDSRARNLQQFDPSMEPDSLLEQLRVLAAELPPSPARNESSA